MKECPDIRVRMSKSKLTPENVPRIVILVLPLQTVAQLLLLYSHQLQNLMRGTPVEFKGIPPNFGISFENVLGLCNWSYMDIRSDSLEDRQTMFRHERHSRNRERSK